MPTSAEVVSYLAVNACRYVSVLISIELRGRSSVVLLNAAH